MLIPKQPVLDYVNDLLVAVSNLPEADRGPTHDALNHFNNAWQDPNAIIDVDIVSAFAQAVKKVTPHILPERAQQGAHYTRCLMSLALGG